MAEALVSFLQSLTSPSWQNTGEEHDATLFKSSWSAIGFLLNKQHYLFPLQDSPEVLIVPRNITPIPLAKPWAWGISNLQGDLLPIFDLNYLMNGKKTIQSSDSRIITVRYADRLIGLLVDKVLGLKHFDHQINSLNSLPTENTPYLSGTITEKTVDWSIFSFAQLANDPQFTNAAA